MVDAGVFMSPCASIQSSPISLPARRGEIGRRADRSGRQRVIAAEDDRERALLERLVDLLVELLADARDFADVFLRRVALGPGFGDRARPDCPCRRPCSPCRRAARQGRRCGPPTAPCRRRGGRRRDRAARRGRGSSRRCHDGSGWAISRAAARGADRSERARSSIRIGL